MKTRSRCRRWSGRSFGRVIAFSVSPTRAAVAEGGSIALTAEAGGAMKVYWLLRRGRSESVVAVDRLGFTFEPGRVKGDEDDTLPSRRSTPTG